ncbi:MAG: alpha-galactosidase [Gammaproteobacteria bacterium]|nr:alpha-galactosidase [Gammaproteobacteria bacterium]
MASLQTADTKLQVEARPQAPRLASLGGPGGLRLTSATAERLPDHVEVGGAVRSLQWHFDRAASHSDSKEIALAYRSEAPALSLVSRWRVRAPFGPIEHRLEIRNLGVETLWLPLQPSLTFDWAVDRAVPLQRLWIEKGADTPSAAGTHLDALRDGDRWEGTSSTYARPIPGEPREMIPWVLVQEPGGAQRGWYLGIEFSGRTHITLERRGASLRGEAGLNPAPGPYRTRLPPGETFTTPTVFIGSFSGGVDGAGNRLRRWVREVLGSAPGQRDPAYPLMVSNSWGSGMAVDQGLAQRMIDDAASLGLEMFHLDAGWFRAVGDWRADPAKFPDGIGALADYAHRRGLRFGLWVSWAQAGTADTPGALRIGDPAMRDWLIADPSPDWQAREPFKGITVDLAVPAAAAWAGGELERIVEDYHLDMLEHDGYLVAQGSSRSDHPAAPPDPATLRVGEDSGYLWVEGSNSTDVSDHATRAYYRIYETLRERHPQLLLELCNDGGRMIDFGSAAHGDYFSITDTYDPLSNRRAFFDAGHVLPPAMLESYVADWPTASLASFRYLLRSGMLGWFSLMLDTRRWTDAQRGAAREEFALYRSKLRPLIRAADLYHVSQRPDGVHWDGLEYVSPALHRGVLYAFRGSAPGEPAHRFRLAGLDAAARYALTFQDRGPASRRTANGEALMQRGVEVALPAPLSSALVFFEQLGPARGAGRSPAVSP